MKHIKPLVILLTAFIVKIVECQIDADSFCDCLPFGSVTDENDEPTCVNGKCQCLKNVIGSYCDSCPDGFYNLLGGKGCIPCGCHPIGAVSEKCHQQTGKCLCKNGFIGDQCQYCQNDREPIINGTCCQCQQETSLQPVCSINEKCSCKENAFGDKCQFCPDNYYKDTNGCKICSECYVLINEGYERTKNSFDTDFSRFGEKLQSFLRYVKKENAMDRKEVLYESIVRLKTECYFLSDKLVSLKLVNNSEFKDAIKLFKNLALEIQLKALEDENVQNVIDDTIKCSENLIIAADIRRKRQEIRRAEVYNEYEEGFDEYEEIINILKEITDDKNELLKKAVKIKNETDEVHKNINELKERINNLKIFDYDDGNFDIYNYNFDEYLWQVEEINEFYIDLEFKIQELNDEIDSFTKIERRIATLQGNITFLNTQLNNAEGTLNTFVKIVEDYQKSSETLQININTTYNDIDNITTIINQQLAEVSKLSNESFVEFETLLKNFTEKQLQYEKGIANIKELTRYLYDIPLENIDSTFLIEDSDVTIKLKQMLADYNDLKQQKEELEKLVINLEDITESLPDRRYCSEASAGDLT